MSRRVMILFVAGVGALVLLWLGGWLLVGGDIPRNTIVRSHDLSGELNVGGMSREQVSKLVTRDLTKMAKSRVVVDVDGRVFKRKYSDLGIFLDAEATVNQIKSRSANPMKIIQALTGGLIYDPVYTFSESTLTRAISDIAAQTDLAPTEGDVVFSGTRPVTVDAAAGHALDIQAAVKSVRTGWNQTRTFKFKSPLIAPEVTTEEAQGSLRLAQKAVSDSVLLTVDGHEIKLKVSDISYALDFANVGAGKLEPRFSSELLTQVLGLKWTKWVTPPLNAKFSAVGGVPKLQPSAPGHAVSDEELTSVLLPAISAVGTARVASVQTSLVEPRVTTEMAGGLGITEVISTFTTKYPPAAYRIQNIHRAADLIDGTILQPGEIFSLNKVVGERTAANGFAEGIIISQGRFEKDFGGGVSQVATTTWNAAWFAGLDLVAHMAHSFYISRYPAGRESTVAWPKVDMRFRNNFDTPIMVDTSYTNSTLTVSIYGKKKFEVETITGLYRNIKEFEILDDDSPTCIHQDGVQGFDITVTRVVKLNGLEVKREPFNTHYIPEDRVTCTNPEAVFGNPTPPKPKIKATPKPATSATPSPTPTATPTASAMPTASSTPTPVQ
ncbi:MAG: VanW family protein [Actinomycetes bacterium]